MKKIDFSPKLGPIYLMHCRCSVWPMPLLAGLGGRCGDCDAPPKPIPDYDDEERDV